MASEQFHRWWSRFVPSGDICPLKLGASRRDVEALFGPPDDFSADADRPERAAIWKYENLELHFADPSKDGLTLIYMDSADGVVLLSIGGSYGSAS